MQQEIITGQDSIPVTLPPDKFYESCRDSLPEGDLPQKKSNHEITSYFTGHLLKPDGFNPAPVTRYQPDWILALLIAGFLLQTWVMFVYRKRFRQVLLAPFSQRFLNQLSRDGNLFGERLTPAMALVYIITTSLIFFQLNELLPGWHFPYQLNDPGLFLSIAVFVILFWTLKVGGILLAGKVFRTETTTYLYLLNVLSTNILAGLILLPTLVLVIYLKSVFFLWIAMFILLFSLLLLFYRGFMIGLTLTKFSYIFLFVYLCTLEILPLIIMIKLSLLFYGSMISVN